MFTRSAAILCDVIWSIKVFDIEIVYVDDNEKDPRLQWRHIARESVSNHQRLDCLSKRLLKKTSKFRVTGLFAGNSPVPGEFPTQRTSNAKSVSIWWRHHEDSDTGGCMHIWLLNLWCCNAWLGKRSALKIFVLVVNTMIWYKLDYDIS